MKYDLLDIISEGKDELLNVMRQAGIDEMIYKMFKYSKRKEIIQSRQLLDEVCGKDGFRKLNRKFITRKLRFIKNILSSGSFQKIEESYLRKAYNRF